MTHYDTLGVSPNATVEEIKAAYRKLVMETHPDVSTNSCDKRFKQISEAHQVLTNARERRAYDLNLKQGQFHHSEWRRRPPGGPSSAGAAKRPWHGGSTPHEMFVNGFFRPRNIMTGIVLGYGAVTLATTMFSSSTENKNDLVDAWKNPLTGKWEQPAPWDEMYQRTKPKIVKMPRNQVQERQL